MSSTSRLPTRLALAAAALLAPARADCMFYQNCIGSPPGCIPQKYDTPQPAFPLTDPFKPCPQFADAGCCTPTQAQTLSISLQLLNFAFGEINNGGCPACMANAHSFWCEFTCSPHQSDFISELEYANVTDPGSGATVLVLQSTITVDKDFACGTYDSCSGVSTVRKDSSLASMEGFFSYQGNTEAIQHGSQILFNFVSAAGGNATNSSSSSRSSSVAGTGRGLGALGRQRVPSTPSSSSSSSSALSATPESNGTIIASPLYSCCNFPLSLSTQKPGDAGVNTSCPCSSCQGMCTGGTCPWGERAGGAAGSGGEQAFPNLGQVVDAPMAGFDGVTVGAFYGAIAAVSLLVLGYQRWTGSKRAGGTSRAGAGSDHYSPRSSGNGGAASYEARSLQGQHRGGGAASAGRR